MITNVLPRFFYETQCIFALLLPFVANKSLSKKLIKTGSIIKQNWNQLLLVLKATALKQQITKFYPQIL